MSMLSPDATASDKSSGRMSSSPIESRSTMRKQVPTRSAARTAVGKMLRAFKKRARQFGAFVLPLAFSWIIAATTMLLALWGSRATAG